MATYYVYSGAGGSANGADWTNAYLTLNAALAVATASDTIYIASDHSESAGAALTLTFPSTVGLRIISSDRTSGTPPTTLATGAEVAIGAVNQPLTLNGHAFIYGVAFRSTTNNSTAALLNIASAATPHVMTFDSCVIDLRTPNATPRIFLGPATSNSIDDTHLEFRNTEVRFGNAAHGLVIRNFRGFASNITLGGTAPTTLLQGATASSAVFEITSSDLTGVAWTNVATTAASYGAYDLRLIQCKLPSGYARFTGTHPGMGGPQLWISDCSSGDVHGIMEYENCLGSAVSNTSIYWTTGAAAQSWKITASANCSPSNPFYTPWVDFYNTGTSSITPYLNVLRNGDSSATAYDNDEVWGEFAVKTNAGFTHASVSSDKCALLATPAAQATSGSTSDWTGDTGSAWFGKVDSGSAVTPDEVGYIRGRVGVGIQIAGYLYVDPQIRT